MYDGDTTTSIAPTIVTIIPNTKTNFDRIIIYDDIIKTPTIAMTIPTTHNVQRSISVII